MTPDPDNPEVLLSVANEIEAGAIVTALAEYGIEAFAAGGYTSGFKAEAPGWVKVLVAREDLDRAKQVLAEIREGQTEIDWSSVDVSKTPVTQTDVNEQDRADSVGGQGGRWTTGLLWIVAICLLILLFVPEPSPQLIHAVAAFGLIVLFLALFSFAIRRG